MENGPLFVLLFHESTWKGPKLTTHPVRDRAPLISSAQEFHVLTITSYSQITEVWTDRKSIMHVRDLEDLTKCKHCVVSEGFTHWMHQSLQLWVVRVDPSAQGDTEMLGKIRPDSHDVQPWIQGRKRSGKGMLHLFQILWWFKLPILVDSGYHACGTSLKGSLTGSWV